MPRAGLNATVIVEKAIEIIDSEGLEHLTLARLASDFNVAAPSLYKHVRGTQALMDQVATQATLDLAEAINKATRGEYGKQALVALCTSYREFAHRRPGSYRLTQRARDYRPWDEAAKEVIAVVVAALHGYGIDGTDISHIRFARSVLHGFVTLELDGGFALSYPIDQSFELLIEQLDSSFQALHMKA
ncbi:MAG: WHG domain-containing protein [Bifidobacterium psychraerophilum]|uniref:TetR/AcrR family transcriptional regulator n=1 Tax=Bifidobacterium psychraerophilum TaxID=218140 RepID=UPI0039ED72F9